MVICWAVKVQNTSTSVSASSTTASTMNIYPLIIAPLKRLLVTSSPNRYRGNSSSSFVAQSWIWNHEYLLICIVYSAHDISGAFWNNIFQIAYVWCLLTYTSWYSLHCVLDKLRTNMYLPVHTVRNTMLWPKSDLPVGHSMQSCDMSKIIIFTMWGHIFNVAVSDRNRSHNKSQWNLEVLKSWSLHLRLYYSLRLGGLTPQNPRSLVFYKTFYIQLLFIS